MSHELGALLLTETISYSINESNHPVFCLFLDARSAFDLTIRELIIRRLHIIGTTGHRLLYLDNRLKSRKTFVEWNRRILGPILDELGFEQGGVSSGDLYTVYNNEQLIAAQDSDLGVTFLDHKIGSLGQADDVVLLSQDLFFLNQLLTLTKDYCAKYHVTLAPEKTKLVAFSSTKQKLLVNFQKCINLITIKYIRI